VALEQFIDYGDWVQQSALADLDTRMVRSLHRRQENFALELADGTTLYARRVVVACGIAPFQRIPAGFDHLPPGMVSHSGDHRDLSIFAGRRVAVLGAGQSAFECAALMHEAGAAQVEVLARDGRIVWLHGHAVKKILGGLGPVLYAPTDVGPLWYSRLVANPSLLRVLPRSAQGRIAARCIRPACSHFVRLRLDPVTLTTGVLVLGAHVEGDALRLRLSDASSRELDHLLLATGYRVDIARYAFLDRGLLGKLQIVDGFPVLGRGLESSIARLHFLGAPAAHSFGPIMRFVSGSWYGARAIAGEIARRTAHSVQATRG